MAGGGTGKSVVQRGQQLPPRPGPPALVYLDFSPASLDIAKYRAELAGLADRVTWLQASIENIPDLRLGHFHFIGTVKNINGWTKRCLLKSFARNQKCIINMQPSLNVTGVAECRGVLHHLPDPETGITFLADSLDPDGGMALMLYAIIGRTGVYQLQASQPHSDTANRTESFGTYLVLIYFHKAFILFAPAWQLTCARCEGVAAAREHRSEGTGGGAAEHLRYAGRPQPGGLTPAQAAKPAQPRRAVDHVSGHLV